MAEVDFSDLDAAQAWFETQSPQMRSAMTSRAALRVLANIGLFDGGTFKTLALPSFRAVLISAVRGSGRTADMEVAADSAARSADSAARSAHTADSAALSALQLDGQRSADQQMLDPLWPVGGIPPAITDSFDNFLSLMGGDPDWVFWRDWYTAVWDGTFRDWDLAHAVARIGDEFWEGEDALAKVAAEIARIKDEMLAKRLPQAEIIFEDENGLYNVRTAFTETSQLTLSVLNRTQFALDMALQSNSCDLNEMSVAAKVLRHALENCTDDPNALEQYFREASAMIKAKVEDNQFSQDDTLGLLVRTLDEMALQLRADHLEVSVASETRVKQALREITDAKRLDIAQSMEYLIDETTGRLSVDYAIGAEVIRQNEAVEAQASAIKRGGERKAKMNILERAKKAEGSGTMATVKMGMRGNSLVELVMSLLGGGS